MAREYSWTNPDGLVVGFGPRDTANKENGPYKTEGLYKQSVKRVIGTELTDTDTVAAQGFEVPIPANSVLTRVYVEVTEAFDSAGDAATLDIGLKEKDGTTISADGIDADIAEAALSAGAVIECDGALIGDTVGAVDSYITLTYETEAFTAGDAKVVVEYLLQPSA